MDGASLLFAPDLIRLEVLAAITRCDRTGEAGVDETTAQCGAWLRHLRVGTVLVQREWDKRSGGSWGPRPRIARARPGLQPGNLGHRCATWSVMPARVS